MLSKTDLSRLDKLIDDISVPSETECGMLREHMESARAGLLGGIEEEYLLSLRLADQAVNCISDQDRKKRVTEMLHELRTAQK